MTKLSLSAALIMTPTLLELPHLSVYLVAFFLMISLISLSVRPSLRSYTTHSGSLSAYLKANQTG